MAGEWIKVRTNLWDDPRVSQLCDLTCTQEATIVGGLYWLWATADEHTETGLLPGLSGLAVDRKTGIKGFGAALVAIGWLSESPEGVTISKFTEHNGKSAKTRATGAKRAADFRSNGDSVTDALHERYETVTGALPREEKRREEKINPIPTSDEVGAASDADDAPTKPDCPHQQIIAMYHEVLPMCPQVRDWTAARAQQLRARWNEDEARQNLDYWRRYFEYVKTCGFLTGNQPDVRRRPFFADLEWLTKSANFAKVRERKYES